MKKKKFSWKNWGENQAEEYPKNIKNSEIHSTTNTIYYLTGAFEKTSEKKVMHLIQHREFSTPFLKYRKSNKILIFGVKETYFRNFIRQTSKWRKKGLEALGNQDLGYYHHSTYHSRR